MILREQHSNVNNVDTTETIKLNNFLEDYTFLTKFAKGYDFLLKTTPSLSVSVLFLRNFSPPSRFQTDMIYRYPLKSMVKVIIA